MNVKQKIVVLFIIAIVCVSALVVYFSGRNAILPDESGGKKLAAKYCQSCHQLPDPSLLDKESWKKILPEMGVRLGMQQAGLKIPPEDKAYYPAAPAMNNAAWQSILDYYNTEAPQVLPLQQKFLRLQPDDGSFTALLPPESMFRPNPLVSCIKMDPVTGRLFLYDASSKLLYLFSRAGLLDSLQSPETIVGIELFKGRIYACSIGNSLAIGTTRNREGKIFEVQVDSKGKLHRGIDLVNGLERPVQMIPTDMNEDNRTDFIVAEFGGLAGELSWFENTGNGFSKHIIREVAGAVTIHAEKIPGRSMPDLWVLFAQGDEGIFHFIPDGNGGYSGSQVLRFPSSYGSTSFQFADMNGDGLRDIIYTCGDNGDGITVLKPYHGIYIFINDGHDKFTQHFFYPMHGCYKAIAGDFGKSGRMDLAAIAYFTDASNPEWFVYLRNDGGMKFTAIAPPGDANFDSALTMDAGDFDKDGLTDIFIGNALDGDNVKGAPFAILKKK